MKTRITPIQLFFLTFSYLLSGFFLYNIHSYYAVAAQFAVFSAFASLASNGLARERRGLSDLVSCYAPGAAGLVFTGLFLVLSVAQMTRTAVFYGESVARLCAFLPWWMIFAAICLCAVLAAKQGMTAVGRFSELLPFLIVPLAFVRPFGDFSPALAASEFDVSGVLSCISSAPVFFLASKTVTSGDAGISEAMRAGGRPPARRAAYLLQLMVAGAAAASLMYVYLTFFTFQASDVFLSLFLWMLHIIRLSILIGIYVDLVAENENPKVRSAYTAVFAVSIVAVFAAAQSGAIRRFRIDSVLLAADFLLPLVLNVLSAIRKHVPARMKQKSR